jgi:ribonuclease HI
MSNRKPSHYAVARGRNEGVYTSWKECEKQVSGYSRNAYKGFTSRSEADAYIAGAKAADRTAAPKEAASSRRRARDDDSYGDTRTSSSRGYSRSESSYHSTRSYSSSGGGANRGSSGTGGGGSSYRATSDGSSYRAASGGSSYRAASGGGGASTKPRATSDAGTSDRSSGRGAATSREDRKAQRQDAENQAFYRSYMARMKPWTAWE